MGCRTNAVKSNNGLRISASEELEGTEDPEWSGDVSSSMDLTIWACLMKLLTEKRINLFWTNILYDQLRSIFHIARIKSFRTVLLLAIV